MATPKPALKLLRQTKTETKTSNLLTDRSPLGCSCKTHLLDKFVTLMDGNSDLHGDTARVLKLRLLRA